MIINISRGKQFEECSEKAKFWNEDRLKAHREDSNLLIGGGFHKGVAVLNTKKPLDTAVDAAEAEYRLRMGDTKSWLKEELALADKDIQLIRSMTRVYGEYYVNESYEMIAPEVTFRVPFPNTEHHCWYFHKFLHNLGLLDEADMQKPDKCGDPRCFQPHWFTGTTDAIIQWNKVIWLMEHKTTAYDLYNDSPQSRNYIDNWWLDEQPTGYIYGIWKAIGVQPQGVLLNVVIKPRKNAVTPVFKFYREGFLRSTDDLLRFEKQWSQLATDYELKMRTGTTKINPKSCFAYNRRCYYHKACISHSVNPADFIQRPPDYVELTYYKILGLEVPKTLEAAADDVSHLATEA